MSGLAPPDAGQVELAGRDVTGDPPYRRAQAGFGRTFQVSSVFPLLSASENVRLAAESALGGTLGLWRRAARFGAALDRADAALERVGLAARGRLAGGAARARRQAKARAGDAARRRARVILLDEPMAGVSAEDVDGLVELIRAVHREEGKTVLMVEHRMEVVDRPRRADRGHAPRRAARVRRAGRRDGNETVQTAYLGEPL